MCPPRLQQGTVIRLSVDDGGKEAEFFSQHTRSGMANLKNKRFAHEGRTKEPSFGVDDGSRKAFSAPTTLKAGMVNKRQASATKSCAHQGCQEGRPSTWTMAAGRPSFGFCSQHARVGMVHIVEKRCVHQGCTKRPSFRLRGSRSAETFSEHSTPGMGRTISGGTSSSGGGAAGSRAWCIHPCGRHGAPCR